jgi:hypothetical protein
MSRFIKLQQFKDYEFDSKNNKPRTDKPVYTELFIPKGMDIIISASGKDGHCILTTTAGSYFYEVKGSPETIRNRIDKEESEEQEDVKPAK